MKNTIILFLFVSTIISCTTNKNNTKNTALIEKYVQAVEDLDYKTMESMLADNYTGHGPSVSDSIGKAQTVKNWRNNVATLYESIHYSKSRNIAVNVESGINQGEWVSNWAQLKIIYKKDEKEVIIWANTVYKIKDSKIVKSYTFYNEADVLEQLGYVFINPSDL